MLTEEQKAQKNRDGVRKWYHENKEDYNAKRRERYRKNKALREKARERAAKYRAEKPKIERQLTREVNGKTVPVFTTGQIAQEMGRTPQMLRNWESHGMIPASIFEDAHRLYTAKQKTLIMHLGSVIAENGGSWSDPAVKKAVANMHKRW